MRTTLHRHFQTTNQLIFQCISSSAVLYFVFALFPFLLFFSLLLDVRDTNNSQQIHNLKTINQPFLCVLYPKLILHILLLFLTIVMLTVDHSIAFIV